MGAVATGTTKADKPEKLAPASKFISEIEYNPKELTMDITFKTGSKLRYLRVVPLTFISFKTSPTIDSFYARAIKGNLTSIKLVDQGIGRKTSTPLDKVKDKETSLNAGFRKQQARRERIAGTVNRAYA